MSLSDAVESLLKPLTRFKVPAHEIGLMLSLSLRFVPTLMDDTTRIMNAQKARGVDFGEGNLVQKVKSIIPILIPLFASSFKEQMPWLLLWRPEVIKEERVVLNTVN